MLENGRRLFQSAENLRQSATDLDALMANLWEAANGSNFFSEMEDLGNETAGADEGWLTPAYAYNAAVLSSPERSPGQRGPSKKPKQVGTLTFLLRLCNSGEIEGNTVKWPWLEQACLILGWHPKDSPDDHWEIDNFNPEEDNIASIIHVESGLWAWRHQNENYAYFFVIPIFVFRNENDLKRFALRPLKELFFSDDPVCAAAKTLSCVPVLQP